MNALQRRPLQIAELAMKTYLGYWSLGSIQGYAREDLGDGVLTDEEVNRIAEKFRFRTKKRCQPSLSRYRNDTSLRLGRTTSL